MKRRLFFSIALLLLAKPLRESQAQGTLVFSNIGGGVNVPISGHGSLLGAGYSAWLALSNGIRIAGPTPFIANGLFSGGVATVPKIPPGETIEVALIVKNFEGEVIGTSSNFEVILGGAGVPPSLPGKLTGLQPFHANGASYYWEQQGPWRVCAQNTPILMLVRVNDSFCEAEEERLNKLTKLTENSIDLEYSLQTDGQLRIRWLAGSSALLHGANSLDRSKGEEIHGDVYQDGYRVLTVSPSEPKKFYWLAEPEQVDKSN